MSEFFSSKSNLLGVLILMIGLLAGLMLVAQNQEIRNRAGLTKSQNIIVCHRTGNPESPWVEMEIPEADLQVHIDHGDILGECPAGYVQGGIQRNLPVETSQNGQMSASGEMTRSVDQNNNVSPDTRDNEGGATRLVFSVTFQGIGSKAEDKKISVSMKSENGNSYFFDNVLLVSKASGVYTGEVQGIGAGRYNILFDAPYYLAKRYDGVDIVRGTNTWDFTRSRFLAGDFDLNNKIDAWDIGMFMSNYNSENQKVYQDTVVFDLNNDGVVGPSDLEILLGNFNGIVVIGDTLN